MAGRELYISEMLEKFEEKMTSSMLNLEEAMGNLALDMKSMIDQSTQLAQITASGIKDPQIVAATLDNADIVSKFSVSRSLSGNTEQTYTEKNALSYAHGTAKVVPSITLKRTDSNKTYSSTVTIKFGSVTVYNGTFKGGDTITVQNTADVTVEYGVTYPVTVYIKGNCADARVSVSGEISLCYDFGNVVKDGALMLRS